MTERGPLHPVTRLGRVLQQIRSFTSLHASELDGVASELEAAGQAMLAARLRVFRDLHGQEARLILDELVDVQAELDREADGSTAARVRSAPDDQSAPTSASTSTGPGVDPAQIDPAADSPKRARWLAEEARKAEEASRPRSRRDLFRGS